MSGTLLTRPGTGKESLEAKLPNTLSTPSMPHQEPLAIKLDSPTILTLAVTTILTAHFATPLYTELLIAVSAAFLLIHHDYCNFLNLGRGGVPSTFRGYLTIAWLRPFALRDPFSPPRPNPKGNPRHGILPRDLPRRHGPRPKVAGIIPHRQLDQRGAEGPHLSLRAAVRTLAAAHPDTLTTALSCFEKHGLGLFATRPVNETCRGEILHVHESDRSMHMNLHPEDIGVILERGWGERHPLARRHMRVNETFVLIYAPRNEEELHIVYRIIEAAVWFVAAEKASIVAT